MGKWHSKEAKIEMLKKVEGLGCTTAGKVLGINKKLVLRWRKTVRNLGEDRLTPGKGIQY